MVGLDHAAIEMGPGEKYILLRALGADVGGCMEPPMPEVPNHWHAYFAVDDADASADEATAKGGKIMVEPFDIPTVGRSAVLTDPQGGGVQRDDAGGAAG